MFLLFLCRMSIGDLTWPVLKTHLTGVVTVSEEEIIAAMKLVCVCILEVRRQRGICMI